MLSDRLPSAGNAPKLIALAKTKLLYALALLVQTGAFFQMFYILCMLSLN